MPDMTHRHYRHTTDTHTQTYIYTHTTHIPQTHTQTHRHAYTHTTDTHTCIHTCIHTYTTHTHHTHTADTQTHIHIHTLMHTNSDTYLTIWKVKQTLVQYNSTVLSDAVCIIPLCPHDCMAKHINPFPVHSSWLCMTTRHASCRLWHGHARSWVSVRETSSSHTDLLAPTGSTMARYSLPLSLPLSLSSLPLFLCSPSLSHTFCPSPSLLLSLPPTISPSHPLSLPLPLYLHPSLTYTPCLSPSLLVSLPPSLPHILCPFPSLSIFILPSLTPPVLPPPSWSPSLPQSLPHILCPFPPPLYLHPSPTFTLCPSPSLLSLPSTISPSLTPVTQTFTTT